MKMGQITKKDTQYKSLLEGSEGTGGIIYVKYHVSDIETCIIMLFILLDSLNN